MLPLPDQKEEIEFNQVHAEDVRGKVARLERHAQGPTVSVGGVAIVHEVGLHRGLWKLGLVERLITEKDELVRGAVVKTTTPKGKSTMLRRPLQRLYPLELGIHQQEDSTPENPDLSDRTADVCVEDRPRREAARRADRERRALIDNQSL